MINKHKQNLEEEKKTLLSELENLGRLDVKSNEWEATVETSSENADSNNSADRFEDFEEKSALVTTLEARLSQVENALEEIKKGTYGRCRVCKNPIEETRIEANPAAETCIAHLEK